MSRERRPRFNYLTFDCYGTLIDWRAGIADHLARMLPPDRPVDRERLFSLYERLERTGTSGYRPYREILAATASAVAETLGSTPSLSEARRFAASVPDWPAFPDTGATLRALGEWGVRRHILSNIDRDTLEATIRVNRWDVDGVVAAEDVRAYKPDPAHWREFLRVTGASPGETLHVAQSLYHDIRPANRLGFATVWVNRYREPTDDIPAKTRVVPALETLIANPATLGGE